MRRPHSAVRRAWLCGWLAVSAARAVAQEAESKAEPVGTQESTATDESLAGSGIPVIEGRPLDPAGATRLQVAGESGLAFRFYWFEAADPGKPASVREFRQPIGAPYPSQVVRRSEPILAPGASKTTDEEGNLYLAYDEPIAVAPNRPLLLGFVVDATYLRDSYIALDPSKVGWDRGIPAGIREQYLADGKEYDLCHEDIQRVAGQLKAGDPDPVELMRRVWAYVNAHFKYKSGPRPNTAPQLLKRGFGTCSEFTRLTVALARACGLPAREVTSLRMNPAAGPVEHNHNWAEMYLPGAGWVPTQTQLKPPTDPRYRCDCMYYLALNRGTGLTQGLPYRSEKRVILHENVKPAAASGRGFGVFIEIPAPARSAAIETLQAIAADDGTKAGALLDEVAKKIHKSVRPVLYWALAASADAKAGEQAAERLAALCRAKNVSLKIDLFRDASPSTVGARIDKALSAPSAPSSAPSSRPSPQ